VSGLCLVGVWLDDVEAGFVFFCGCLVVFEGLVYLGLLV
jgi:hypothetical protein